MQDNENPEASLDEFPWLNALIVYSKISGTDWNPGAGYDARPVGTDGVDFYLGVKGNFSGNVGSSLKFYVVDSFDLTDKTITAYDTVQTLL